MTSQNWYALHPGKKAEHQKRWRQAHPRTAAQRRKERAMNPEINRRACRKWRKNHRAHMAALASARRGKLRSMWNKLTKKQQKQIIKIYERASCLRQWFKVVVDHKIPLCKGGKHHPDNLQIIYDQENQIKGSNSNFIPSVIFS